jgi:hypothetical protein
MKGRGAVLTCLVLAVACGGSDGPTGPTPPPDIAGTYSAYQPWTLQVLRTSDNFQKSFTCGGSLTISQGATTGAAAPLSGFVVVGSPCEPVSFELTGTIQSGGVLTFVTDGPRPTEGPCPGGRSVTFSGQVTGRNLSARGVTRVQCPQFGEHVFTYLLSAAHN